MRASGPKCSPRTQNRSCRCLRDVGGPSVSCLGMLTSCLAGFRNSHVVCCQSGSLFSILIIILNYKILMRIDCNHNKNVTYLIEKEREIDRERESFWLGGVMFKRGPLNHQRRIEWKVSRSLLSSWNTPEVEIGMRWDAPVILSF